VVQDAYEEVIRIWNELEKIFSRSTWKFIRRASQQLQAIPITVWQVVRKKRLLMTPYGLQLLQALSNNDKQDFSTFCVNFLDRISDKNLMSKAIFSDELTFHLSGNVNKHNCRIWALHNPRATVALGRDAPKVNAFFALSEQKVYRPFFFVEKTFTGSVYLDMLENCLWPQLAQDTGQENIINQQDGAPSHYQREVRHFLDEHLTGRWTGRRGPIPWPPRSPDLTALAFFWRMSKNTFISDHYQEQSKN
jgi:hypothetical protein